MLCIDYKDRDSENYPDNARTIIWKIGEELPMIKLENQCVDNVDIVSIYADGEEFKYIIAQVTGIPFTTNRTDCIWRGEFARFIFENVL